MLDFTRQMYGATTIARPELEDCSPGVRVNLMPSQEDAWAVVGEADECAFGCTHEQVIASRHHWVPSVVPNPAAKRDQSVQLLRRLSGMMVEPS